MELDYNLYALFETVGIVQAITLGALLIFLNKNKYKSTLFVGIFLILFGLETIPIVLNSLNAYLLYPELYLLPFDFFWLHFPIFYVYVHQICIFSNEKTKYWVLYPGIAILFAQIAVFFLPYTVKVAITESVGYDIYFYCKVLYGLSIGIYTLRLLFKHKIEVHNYFSMMESKELTWARIFLFYNISGSIVYTIFATTITDSLLAKIFFATFDLILIYWVSYHGVKQRNILSLLAKKEDFEGISQKLSAKEDLLALSDDGLQELMERIDKLLRDSESFTDTDLTIMDLANELDTHPKRISTAINVICHQNFNAYVNRFRIRKAEKMLENEAYTHLSVEGIGKEVGFHSKSAFYSAFKKFTGTTPSKYKENVMV
ncbi:helix-turn-helix domain-containing protein [Pricia sp.]|uniref:helix-turn-helix domain-containing protein n=1 Tax=Pricia sp. TaxID=2268138 RepID=UPI0035949346